ncbi:hypothetical protein IQ264_04870 [Phormidium sp. LEGE 05292]|uniref:hypothetical protein n=1 Tax=[Phormidium] sp. LEGE 05292 TaxID=767427 RepID=UPI00187FA648|nr:hypothetical protein [Phormidium sp. LEGE 05292]MBE9224800.1 hypothetical protein [Phormidium sp. LEGE 05292]
MEFPGYNLLPTKEYAKSRVVVYYYTGQWVPIMFHQLVDAIAIHRKAKKQGKELFIFPPDVNPKDIQDAGIFTSKSKSG